MCMFEMLVKSSIVFWIVMSYLQYGNYGNQLGTNFDVNMILVIWSYRWGINPLVEWLNPTFWIEITLLLGYVVFVFKVCI
jgi:hypothetical protein